MSKHKPWGIAGVITGALLAVLVNIWLFMAVTYTEPVPKWVAEWLANPPAVTIPTNLVIQPASGGEG